MHGDAEGTHPMPTTNSQLCNRGASSVVSGLPILCNQEGAASALPDFAGAGNGIEPLHTPAAFQAADSPRPSHFRKFLREVQCQEYHLQQHLLMSPQRRTSIQVAFAAEPYCRLPTHVSAHVGVQQVGCFLSSGEVLGSKLKTRLRLPATALDTEAFRDGTRPHPSRRHSRS